MSKKRSREHGIFVWETCLRHGSPISRDRRARDFVPGSVFHSRTNARSEIRRMLMRRPVSCSDTARGIILVEIKFRNPPWDGVTASLRRNPLANRPSLRHYGNRPPLERFRFLCPMLQLYGAIVITVCERLFDIKKEMQSKIFFAATSCKWS